MPLFKLFALFAAVSLLGLAASARADLPLRCRSSPTAWCGRFLATLYPKRKRSRVVSSSAEKRRSAGRWAGELEIEGIGLFQLHAAVHRPGRLVS